MTHEQIVADARKGFPNASTDVEALVLRIRQFERFKDERLEYMRLNAKQAGIIADLERALKA